MIIGYDASRAFIGEKTGTETYSYQLLKALLSLQLQHCFRVYVRPNVKAQALWIEGDRVKINPVSWPYLWTQGGLAWRTWKDTPDVLFVPSHVVPLLKNPRVPVVVTVHDLALNFLTFQGGFLRRFYLGWGMERLRARMAAHLIAVSRATKKDVVEKLNVPEEKVSVIYEGVDERFKVQCSKLQVDQVKQKYGIKGEYILFVGTVQPRKNLVRLIQAFSMVAGEHELPISLVIAGKQGWSYEEIYAAPEKFGAGNKVKFLGYVSSKDLPALYAGTLAFCLPSLHEGFGLPVLEALSAGSPVVVSRVSSLTEVGGTVAVYVDPYRSAGIARGLWEVLSWDKTTRLRRIEQGKIWAAKFTWHKAALETVRVLERVLKRV